MATSIQRKVLSAATAILAGLAVNAANASAQSLWMPRDNRHALLLEALHPSFEGSDPEGPTGAAYLGARMRIGSGTSIVVEVPYARFKGVLHDYALPYTVDDALFGNPYLGFEFQPEGSVFFVELGGRAPIADTEEWDGHYVGEYSDHGRFDAFAYDVLPIHLIANVREVTASGFTFRFRLGPMMLYPTNGYLSTSDFYAMFAWQFGYEAKAFRAGTAISGTSYLNGNRNLGTRTSTSFEAHADFGPWRIRPGLELKMPIGSTAEVVPIVLGMSVGASW